MDGSPAPLPSNGVPPGGTIASGAGSGYLHAMQYCVSGYTQLFLTTLLHTFGMAAALSVGAMLTSSVLRAILPRFAPLGR